MKQTILGAVLATLTALSANAGPSLESIDKLKSCSTEQQQVMAQKILNHFENFAWWNIKALMAAMHPEFTEWHASRVFMATLYPESAIAKLPYKSGITSKENYVEYLAMIAYLNDVPKYTVDIKRIECTGNDTAVLTAVFNGTNLYRDAKGKALYKTEIKDLSTRFVAQVKEGLIYKLIVDVEESTTQKMMDELTALIKAGVQNVNSADIPDQKYEDILADFKKQLSQ